MVSLEESTSLRVLAEECLGCPIRQFTIYGPLPPDDIQEFVQLRRGKRKFAPKSIILRQGDTTKLLYTLLNGWACRYKLMSDGRRQILSFLLPGNAIGPGFLQREAMPFGVEAVTDVLLCAIDAAGYLALLSKRSELALSALRSALIRADLADELVVTLEHDLVMLKRIRRF